MLKGDTQSGKTFLVEVLAVRWAEADGPAQADAYLHAERFVRHHRLRPVRSDHELHGSRRRAVSTWCGCPVSWISAAQVGGILYLDEINAFGERVTSSLHPLADHRHTFVNRNKPVWKNGQFMPDTVTASMDLWIIGTYNEGYRGMGEMNEAFINRFRHIRWDYDKEIEAKLITSPGIRLLGEALRTARAANQIRTPVGTSALQHIEEDLATFGIAMAMQIFTGMFKANEVPVVESIIEDRSIFVMLQEELRQAATNA